jgi:hypothetical protein
VLNAATSVPSSDRDKSPAGQQHKTGNDASGQVTGGTTTVRGRGSTTAEQARALKIPSRRHLAMMIRVAARSPKKPATSYAASATTLPEPLHERACATSRHRREGATQSSDKGSDAGHAARHSNMPRHPRQTPRC